MRLADLFGPNDEFEDVEAVITVRMSSDLLSEISVPVNESVWKQSSQPGILVRVDPARPEMNQLRHVHLAQKKHITSKSQQASWNDDASRHDRKTFNTKLASRQSVQTAARDALGLGPDIVLEWATHADSIALLAEGVLYDQPVSLVLNAFRSPR